jgi:hypothetical protein
VVTVAWVPTADEGDVSLERYTAVERTTLLAELLEAEVRIEARD